MVLKRNTVISEKDKYKVLEKYYSCKYRNEYTDNDVIGDFLAFECEEHYFILEGLYQCNNAIFVKKVENPTLKSAVLDFASVCEKLVTEYNVEGFLIQNGKHNYRFIERFVGKECVKQFNENTIFVWIGDIYNNGKKQSKNIWVDKVNKLCIRSE